MHKKHDRFGIFVKVALCLLVLLSFGAMVFSEKISTNRASILGGVIGAGATIVLGLIAFWQNKRYKELSDELSERPYIPELYRSESLSDQLDSFSKGRYNSVTATAVESTDLIEIDCGYLTSINAPLCLFRVKELQNRGKTITFLANSRSFYKDTAFKLFLKIPEQICDVSSIYSIVIEYENIYGMRYEKLGTFMLSTGKKSAVNWKFERARKITEKEEKPCRAKSITMCIKRGKQNGSSNSFHKPNLILIWGLVSIIWAIIIHILFHWNTCPEWLVAKWGAGDILTYSSTVSLGLLAFWQNQRFKEENAASQARLESLTVQANDQAVINKIIEVESAKLSEIKSAVSGFSDACDPVLGIVSSFLERASSEENAHSTIRTYAIQKRKIDEKYAELLMVLNIAPDEASSSKNQFLTNAIRYKDKVEEIIKLIAGLSTPYGASVRDEQLELLYSLRGDFETAKNNFILQREKTLRQIIYGKLSFFEIKELINARSTLLDDFQEE